MKCPFCGEIDNKVIDSRLGKDGNLIRRRRECIECGARFTTHEHIEEIPIMILKKDGRREIFSREKIRSGIQRACEKRDISMDAIEEFLDELERDIRKTGEKEIPSTKIGEKILLKLHELDGVAYVRFASVYREFKDVNDFIFELKRLLRHNQQILSPQAPEKMTRDEYFMNIALDLAARGKGYTSPNPVVGAVVVRDGKIVGKGYHQRAGGPHAEVHAIDDAGEAAKDATLYVTLEPCNHTGRTPPCTEKILQAGIAQVVVAMRDPNPDVEGNGIDYLTEKGVEVNSGICEDAAKKQNEVFVKYIMTKRPFVLLKCAATLDGYLATSTGDSKWVSGEASRRYAHQLRHELDAILVGIGTIRADDPRLTARLDDKKSVDPIRIILDTHLSISEDAGILNADSEAETLIITGQDISEEKAARIESPKKRIICSSVKEGRIDLDLLMDQLGKMGITSILIEGGGSVIASAFEAGIVDKVTLVYAPKVLGGNDGIPMCSGKGPLLMKDCIRIKDMTVHRFESDVMIEGYVDRQE